MSDEPKVIGCLGDRDFIGCGGMLVYDNGDVELIERYDSIEIEHIHQLKSMFDRMQSAVVDCWPKEFPMDPVDRRTIRQYLINALEDEVGHWKVYRFSLDECTFINGVLSDNPHHLDHSAWFWQTEEEKKARPQDTNHLESAVESCDYGCYLAVDDDRTPLELAISDICSDDIMLRARVYECLVSTWGPDEFDQYPIEFFYQAEMKKRYKEEERQLRSLDTRQSQHELAQKRIEFLNEEIRKDNDA